MESLDYWRLCDELSVRQATLLILDLDPSGDSDIEAWDYDKQPVGYEAAKTALINAINSYELAATIRRNMLKSHIEDVLQTTPIAFSTKIAYELDINLTTVRVRDIRQWLMQRGIKSGFFFPANTANTPEFLDKGHPCYSPKLAAAVDVWKAISMELSDSKSKKPKKAIEKWLRIHASAYGLIKEDGTHNELGIEEVTKVANWETRGGAPRQ